MARIYRQTKSLRLRQVKLPKLPRVPKLPKMIDIHFHGAFGVDLMKHEAPLFDQMAQHMKAHGVHAFCPTTLSEQPQPLTEALNRIGSWVKTQWKHPKKDQAFAIGIHLEGPFLDTQSRGAHAANTLRKVTLTELNQLWKASHETICLITLAPEQIDDPAQIVRWAQDKKITLSLGHSSAGYEVAQKYFSKGFSGVTHAFNAMKFHHRDPAILGAALHHPVHVEAIIDQIHVSPEALRWLANSYKNGLCFISDCAPAACLHSSKWSSFGPLTVQNIRGACRLKDGSLAGGGRLVSQSLIQLLSNPRYSGKLSLKELQKEAKLFGYTNPLKAIHSSWTKRVPK